MALHLQMRSLVLVFHFMWDSQIKSTFKSNVKTDLDFFRPDTNLKFYGF